MKTAFNAIDSNRRAFPSKARAVDFARRRGVALIITLIMLAVITFMAITFLVLSHRERGAVTTTTDQTTAEFAADSALDRAEIELIAHALAFTNGQDFDLIVSTNFINHYGFDPTAMDYRTNVNFDYIAAAGRPPLTPDEWRQNLTNLLYDPRPPVFVEDRAAGNSSEFRFYLDLNRNRLYDTNGYQPVLSPDPALPYYNASNGVMMDTPVTGLTLSNYFTGDPEWIGVLEYPDQPHSANNKFLARYAFLVVPTGKTLDANYIHNDSALGNFNAQDQPFRRNMGMGTWEINLAALLADVNTNQWDSRSFPASPIYYEYLPLQRANGIAHGIAFDDAQSFLNWRYNGTWNNLARLTDLFPPAASRVFQNDLLDEFGAGALGPDFFTGTDLQPPDGEIARINSLGWPGADNPSHFFTPQDFFDPAKTSLAFSNRLWMAGATNTFYAGSTNSSYDRYTLYRLLAQLGTDSAPEQDKINVNYANVDTNGTIVPGMETNMIPWNIYPWNATAFFNIAADRLLRTNTTLWSESPNPVDRDAYFLTFGVTNGFGVSNIPVFASFSFISNSVLVTNNIHGYTPGVHRLLQLAANIYDATTNRFPLQSGTNVVAAPTVWRPIFRRNPGPLVTNVFIVAYREISTFGPPLYRQLTMPTAGQMVDLDDPVDRARIPALGVGYDPNPPSESQSKPFEPMVYGIPLVIGAKKGLPNFNKFGLQNSITVTRKLEFHRLRGAEVLSWTNQLYTMGITNSFGAQAWNSYTNPFARPVQVVVSAEVYMTLTNQFGSVAFSPISIVSGTNLATTFSLFSAVNINTNWPAGFTLNHDENSPSFMVPLVLTNLFLPNSTFIYSRNLFVTSAIPDQVNYFPVPRWWLFMKTRLRYALIDRNSRRILDYANLEDAQDPLDVMRLLRLNAPCNGDMPSTGDPDPGSLWCTNRLGNPTEQPSVVDNFSLPTYGIMNQIEISMGLPRMVSDSFWRKYNSQVNDKDDSVKTFNNRMFGDPSALTSSDDLNFGTPFNPARTIYQYVRWEANDPLVHYTIPDLTDQFNRTNMLQWDVNDKNPVFELNGQNGQHLLAQHYRPWGGSPWNTGADPNKVNIAVKDPLMAQSDGWDFPTNKLPNIGWLGRVHRGSPWQTVYMKSRDDVTNYPAWSGDMNLYDSYYMNRPVNDRMLFDMFTTAMNDNATRGQLSVNQTNLAAWSAVLSGVFAITNSSPPTNVIIEPAGAYIATNPPPIVRIVNGINNARSATIVYPGNLASNVFPNAVFGHKGDILATPELTVNSPFLSTNNPATYPPSDAIMERIPQQIMGLLSMSHSPRFVIYAYGQTLHPAEHSIYTGSGPFFGLCTNYQVTAETATRAVVRLDGLPENPHLVVEQFNILPPD